MNQYRAISYVKRWMKKYLYDQKQHIFPKMYWRRIQYILVRSKRAPIVLIGHLSAIKIAKKATLAHLGRGYFRGGSRILWSLENYFSNMWSKQNFQERHQKGVKTTSYCIYISKFSNKFWNVSIFSKTKLFAKAL